MAKKKRRRRQHRPRPQGGGVGTVTTEEREAEAERAPSRRAERKEEARRERERRLRQARRRQRTRRLVRWGIGLAVLGGIAGIWYIATTESRELQEKADAAARRIEASDVETEPAALPNQHTEPYAVGQNGIPAFGGNHTPGTLPAEPKVYEQQPPEETAIHNLEHGYVIVYYAAEGENALDEDLVAELEGVANDETEVLMSPYAGLAQPLYLVAWGARQALDPPADADPDDVVLVARGFIDEWKNGDFAPEAASG